MALWQFDCMIIPKRNEFIDTKSEEILSWKNVEVPVNIREIVQGILPLSEGWSDKVLIYGEIDGTCIELFLEEEKVEEIILRMDLRDLTKKMLERIMNVVNMIDGKILYDNIVYPAEMEALIPLMKESNAGRFSRDQEKYFEEIDKRDTK